MLKVTKIKRAAVVSKTPKTPYWATPHWDKKWKRTTNTYVRSACTFEVRFIPKRRRFTPKRSQQPKLNAYPQCFFPSAELWRIHHNGCVDLLVRLSTYACPLTKEKAFDTLTDLGRRLGVWV